VQVVEQDWHYIPKELKKKNNISLQEIKNLCVYFLEFSANYVKLSLDLITASWKASKDPVTSLINKSNVNVG